VTTGFSTEVTGLTGIDLEGAPPCECVSMLKVLAFFRAWKCRRASAARVTVRCLACNGLDRVFLCKMHVRFFLHGRLIRCCHCGATGTCSSAPS